MKKKLKPNITKFGSNDADDCDNTNDEFNDVGLYCPQCWEYMSNPWTCTVSNTVSSILCSWGKDLEGRSHL